MCRRLHGEWAERLRKGKALPDVSMRYFGEGYIEEKRGVKNHVNQTHRACGVLDGDGEREVLACRTRAPVNGVLSVPEHCGGAILRESTAMPSVTPV